MSETLHIGTLKYWDEERQYGEIQPESPNPNHGLVGVFHGAFAGLPAPVVGQRFLFTIAAGFSNGLTTAQGLQPLPGVMLVLAVVALLLLLLPISATQAAEAIKSVSSPAPEASRVFCVGPCLLRSLQVVAGASAGYLMTVDAAVAPAAGGAAIAPLMAPTRLRRCRCPRRSTVPDFLTTRLGWSRASGYRFIAVFGMLTQSQIETEDLTIDASSLYRIAAPSTPAEVREQVLGKAATPEGISRTEVEQLVAAAKAEGGDAVRSEYSGKLVLSETELEETVQEITGRYDAKIARLTDINCWPVAANSAALLDYGTTGEVYSTGLVAIFSTSGCFTNTASATAFFKIRKQ